jgi:hypothetical protein
MRTLIPNKAFYFLLPLVLLLTARVQADSMRCGSQLVTRGDSRSEVRFKCGEPTDVETRSILRRPFYGFSGPRNSFYPDSYVEVPIEVWTYNFGPYKLMRQVQFVNGRIDDILTMGYGYHDDNY